MNIDDRIADLEALLNRLLVSIGKSTEVLSLLAKTNTRLIDFYTKLDDKTNSVISSVDAINTSLDNITENFSSLNKRLTTFENNQTSSFEALESKFADLSKKVDNVMSNALERIDTVEEALSNIEIFLKEKFDDYDSTLIPN